MAGPSGEDGKPELAFKDNKVFNDPIHGHIEVDPLSVKIIDTPQFQRLRFIKQLGGADWVFPGATHNRFEHSIGVYYLAGRLVTELQKKQPELEINDRDVLCVMIGGLCHDLGHGPFSHLFEQFMEQARPDAKWKHEEASTRMFDHLIDQNKINLDEFGLTAQDQTFIKELIKHPKSEGQGAWPYEGREEEKGFLYQIVCNEPSGMDVDKWDYFARDSYFLGLPKKFDHMQLIQHARVIKVDGEEEEEGKWQICYRKKEWPNVYDMFYTRACLHRQAYQHKAIKAVEMMILDALLEADVKDGKEAEKRWLSKAAAEYDMASYTNMTDQVFQEILYSKNPGLKKAKDILQKVVTRKLYRFVDESDPSKLEKEIAKESKKITAEDFRVKEWPNVYDMFYTRACLHRQAYQHKAIKAVEMMKEAEKRWLSKAAAEYDMASYTNMTDQVFQEILYSKNPGLKKAKDILQKVVTRKLYRFVDESDPSKLEKEIAKESKKITAEDFRVKFVKVDYGKGDENPVKNVHFWNKDNPTEAESLEENEVRHYDVLSQMLPVKFADRFVRVYCKKQDKGSNDAVKSCFKVFLDKKRGETTPPRVRADTKDITY
ncbi:deoxynucleoside triphosphate triphosphohydrolase SAMHD1-like [Branchiostoma floridae x Branchiostoma japonicum]